MDIDKYVFKAKIEPALNSWQLEHASRIKTPDIDSVDIIAKFDGVDVEIFADAPPGTNIYSLRNVVHIFCQTTLDALSYLEGFPLRASMARDVLRNETACRLALGPEVLLNTRHKRTAAGDYSRILTIASESFELRCAMSDLRSAVENSSDTGFFCFRAIEALRQTFHTKERGKKESSRQKEQTWSRLASALLIDSSWFDEIRAFSQFQRHGAPMFMSDETRSVLLLRTTEVVDRFCLYQEGREDWQRGIELLACERRIDGNTRSAKCLGREFHEKSGGEESNLPGASS
jgi:hypothetical protein